MSSAVFPTLTTTPGLTWKVGQSPQFSTKVQRSVALTELRAAYAQYPLWTISLKYDLLRSQKTVPAATYSELETIAGFFLARQGMFDNFFYTNPNDKTATAATIGTGNASNTTFQLCRSIGAGGFTFNEPVNNVNVLTSVTFNGVVQAGANYSTNSTGLVTFSNASTRPGNGVVVAWNGTYYYQCRFLQDSAQFDEFMYGLFELQKLEFVGSVVDKV